MGIALTSFMFGFGSYMNSGYADLMRVSQVSAISGIAIEADLDVDFSFMSGISGVDPETIIVISYADLKCGESGILTVDPDLTDAFDGKILNRKQIFELTQLDYVGVCEEAFLNNENFIKLTEKLRNVYPSSRIVPLLFQRGYEKGYPYRLSRRLGENVLVVADFKKTKSVHEAINALRDTMFERTISNIEISGLNGLAVENTAGLKTLMYAMHFSGAKNVEHYGDYFVFKKGESSLRNNQITILGVGDMMLGRYVRTLMDGNGMGYPFEKIKNELGGIDYIFSNFEGPIKENEVATQKSISFRFKPDVVWAVKDAGINIVSLANNHALDQGWGGRDDTMKFLKEAGIYYFGHPKNEVEGNVYMGQVADKTVAFVGFDDTIFKINEDSARQIINELDIIADYVIVSVHWGVEYVHQPTERKKMLAHLFVDSGADIVIGHHPHVVQTMEIYNGKPVFYSLGNFIFDQYFSQDTQEGLGIGVIIDEDKMTVYLLPYAIPASQPVFIEGEAKTAFLEKFISWGNYDEETKNSIRNGVFMLK